MGVVSARVSVVVMINEFVSRVDSLVKFFLSQFIDEKFDYL
jgi:hypothetical protein